MDLDIIHGLILWNILRSCDLVWPCSWENIQLWKDYLFISLKSYCVIQRYIYLRVWNHVAHVGVCGRFSSTWLTHLNYIHMHGKPDTIVHCWQLWFHFKHLPGSEFGLMLEKMDTSGTIMCLKIFHLQSFIWFRSDYNFRTAPEPKTALLWQSTSPTAFLKNDPEP